MKQDKFLLGILIGIGVLIVVSLVVFFNRQKQVAYMPDADPASVVHNYVLALQQGDFQRAYAYLADMPGKPGPSSFPQHFISGKLDISKVGVEIGPASVSGDQASVSLTMVHSDLEQFDRIWNEYQTASLVRENGAWKITTFPYPYWSWDWNQTPQPKFLP